MAGFEDRDGKIWMDGSLVDWRAANVHILTHALHYGSAVFEGERSYGGRIFRSTAHSERLRRSGALLDMEIPWSLAEIDAAKAEVLQANGLSDAYLRAIAFRAAGDEMGVAAASNPVRLAIAAWQQGAYYGEAKRRGARLDLAKWRRPAPETIPCEAKASGLYMICTMSKHAAQARGCSDALMLDYRGYVAEATGANIFFVKEGQVHTPLPDCFLNGITRQTVIALLRAEGITVHERHILPEELDGFEECWLTGSAAEITPVREIAAWRFEPGALTRQVMEGYESLVRA